MLAISSNNYNSITDEENEEMGKTYDPSNLLFKVYKYDRWYNKLGEVRESYEDKSKS